MEYYTADYFIKKFEAIPSKNILAFNQGTEMGVGCAYGQCRTPYEHCGEMTEEGIALTKLLSSIRGLTMTDNAFHSPYLSTPARINNGDVAQYQQPTPKQRILAALHDIKKLNSDKEVQGCDTTKLNEEQEGGKTKIIIKYVSVEAEIKKQKEELILN